MTRFVTFAARRVIAAVEMLGGAMGALLFLRHAFRVTHTAPHVWVVAPIHVVAFGFCFFAGLLLWRGGARGRALTAVALALQLPIVRTATLGYYLNCGVGVRILFRIRRVSWLTVWGSELHLTRHDGSAIATIGINVVALVFLLILLVSSSGEARD